MSDRDLELESHTIAVSAPVAGAAVSMREAIAQTPPPAAVAKRSQRRLHRLMPLVSSHVQRLGVPGVAGVAALIFCLTVLQSSLLPLHTRLVGLRAAAKDSTAVPGTPSAPAPAEQAASFIAQLPDRNSLPAVLGAIVQQAEGAGLSLDRGSYQWSLNKTGRTARYELTLPVKGSYPAVRKFVDKTLEQVPAAALVGMSLERANVGDAMVSANLRFDIFVRSAP